MSVRSFTQDLAAGIGLGASALQAYLLYGDEPSPDQSKLKAAAALVSLLCTGYLATRSNPGNVKNRIEQVLAQPEEETTSYSQSGELSDSGCASDSPIPATLPTSSSTGPWLAAGLGCASALSLLPGATPARMALSAIAGISPLITAGTKVAGDRQIDEACTQVYQRILTLHSKPSTRLGHTQSEVEGKLREMTPAQSLEALADQYRLFYGICTVHRSQTPKRGGGQGPTPPATTTSNGSR